MQNKKKGKGKKSKKQENRTDILTEVDKTFYELQITDLNRKLVRAKQVAQEFEEKNAQLENKLENLDEDRADVISYLKRIMETKQSESLELQERLTALEETKESEGKEHEEKIEELQLEYNVMREQLTSENKLLLGKLNALEEFRMQRDDLLERFEEQEKIIQEQEMKEKKTMYEIEKKLIISKKNIASEMEQQLFNLANNFEKANQIRIAATTHRCIRENIALNNELNKMISSLGGLNQQVDDYKLKNVELKLNCELYQAERNNTMNELQLARSHLDQMTKDFQARVKILRTYESQMKKNQKMYEEMKHAQAREAALAAKVRILEQNLHATRCKEMDLKDLVTKQKKMVGHFQDINREAVIAIESCLQIALNHRLDEAGKQYRRDILLQNLLTILTQPNIDTYAVLSMDTIDTIDSKYKRGDLGFMPKEVQYPKTKNFQELNAAVQVTLKLDDPELRTSPVTSHISNQSMENKSISSNLSGDSTQYQACSMLDIDRSFARFSSILFCDKFASGDLELLLSDQDVNKQVKFISPEISSDPTLKTMEEQKAEESEAENYEEEISAGGQSNEGNSAEEKSAEGKFVGGKSVEEKYEEEEMENTVFGNDDDEEFENDSPSSSQDK